jgi:hypothetical protein
MEVCFLLFWKSFKFRKSIPSEMEMIRVSGGELGFVR